MACRWTASPRSRSSTPTSTPGRCGPTPSPPRQEDLGDDDLAHAAGHPFGTSRRRAHRRSDSRRLRRAGRHALGPGSRSIGIAVAHACADRHHRRHPRRHGGARGPAADRIVHVADARVLALVPRGMDRSSRRRSPGRPSGLRLNFHRSELSTSSSTPGPTTCSSTFGSQPDRQFHATSGSPRLLGRGLRLPPSRSPSTAPRASIEAVTCLMAAVTTAGRGYFVWLYTPTSNEGFAFAPYDRAWFEELLATVQLRPRTPSIAAAPLDPELHLDAARILRVAPRGLDR